MVKKEEKHMVYQILGGLVATVAAVLAIKKLFTTKPVKKSKKKK